MCSDVAISNNRQEARVSYSHDQMEVAMILQNIWINMSNCFVLGWKNPAFIL